MSEHTAIPEDARRLDPRTWDISSGNIEISDIDLDEEVVIMDGKRYTEAGARRDADAAEARLRGLSRGGRSLSGDGSHSPTLRTVVPRDVSEAVKARARAEHMSVSKWLRRLIERSIAA